MEAGRVDADRWGGGCARKARMDCGQSLGAEILGCLDLPVPFLSRLAAPPAFLSPTVTATTSTSHQQRPPARARGATALASSSSFSIALARRRHLDRACEAPVARPACTSLSS